MLNKLFSSKSRVEIMKLFLFNPEDSFYQREISRITHLPIRGVQRELKNLCNVGLIEDSISGNRVYYKINKEHPIFEDLKKIFFKTTGIAEVLKDNLSRVDSIKIAFIYGSFAKGKEEKSSDIDLLIIGSITSKQLSSILSKPKMELNREINYIVFDLEEIAKKVTEKNHFLNSVLAEEKIFIIGNENELKTVVKPE